MTDPASPEGMLRSYHGEDNTGLSAIREKPVDDRSVFQQTRDYLTKGINEDAGDALGPHAAPALIGLGSLLGEIFGPGADVRDAVTASGETTQAVKEGDILGAGVGGLNTLASVAMMGLVCFYLSKKLFIKIFETGNLEKALMLILIIIFCKIIYLAMIFMLKVITVRDLKGYIKK